MSHDANTIELKALEILKTIIDPELGINLVDLGLIYAIESKSPDALNVEMTLSSKACPLGDVILNEVSDSLSAKFSGININVELVWEPAWSTSRISPEGMSALGL
jgi:metal-sulfur cluster biosynthetic enzyme